MISAPLSWPQGRLHHAGNDVARTDLDFPQQSWNDNIIAPVANHRPLFEPEALDTLEHATLPFDGFAPSSIQPVPDVQPLAYPNLAGPLLLLPEPVKHAEAVVMERTDGKFCCSQLGCDAVYVRPGDCRRHLKLHNGPFFPCKQPGCDMKFYRRDKLRDHMKQGHNIVVAAPRRGRRAARLTAHQGADY